MTCPVLPQLRNATVGGVVGNGPTGLLQVAPHLCVMASGPSHISQFGPSKLGCYTKRKAYEPETCRFCCIELHSDTTQKTKRQMTHKPILHKNLRQMNQKPFDFKRDHARGGHHQKFRLQKGDPRGKPQTLNPPETRNPKPQTLNPKPYTLNPQTEKP